MQDYEVDHSKMGLLGAGAFGKVFKATRKADRKCVAVKRIALCPVEGIPSSAIREAGILQSMPRHRNVIWLHDVVITSKELYLVMPRFPLDLDLLIRSRDKPLPTRTVKHVAAQILDGLKHCHENGVIHRDLKPSNVLVTQDLSRVVLADFGIARSTSLPGRHMTLRVVSLWYRAPELFGDGQVRYGAAVDIWSFGCVLAEMIKGEPLYPGKDDRDQSCLLSSRACPAMGTDDPALNEAVEEMLRRDPAARPNCWTLAERAYFHAGAPIAGDSSSSSFPLRSA
jgi:serine/threonine protein kinase